MLLHYYFFFKSINTAYGKWVTYVPRATKCVTNICVPNAVLNKK